MHKHLKKYGLFIATSLILLLLLAYFGIRTIKHEALLAQTRTEALAHNQLTNVEDFLNNLLKQKASRFETIANYIDFKNNSIQYLLDKDTDIDNIFVIQQGKLVYPKSNQNTSQKNLHFLSEVAPIIDDPTLLYVHNVKEENNIPNTGWYNSATQEGPILIYWHKQGDTIIGFRLSYVQLLSDVINLANFSYMDGNVEILEQDRLLYRSQSPQQAYPNTQLLANKHLSYPLTGWQIRYNGLPANLKSIYITGATIIFLLLTSLALIIFRLYREYTYIRRQALQQVNFVNQVSHELKTPLTNITLYAELLQEDLEAEGAQENLHALEVIISESRRLSRLIQNILSFTRESQPHIQAIDLNELLKQITQTFTPSLAVKGIQLIQTSKKQIILQTDKDLVSQIICNFLSNAEKYASSGKRIDLCIEEDSDYVNIEVRDYGQGITPDELKLIFNPFYRTSTSISEGISGTGIGLTICKQLADVLDAIILANNAHPGMCFTLRLKK